MIYSKKEKGGLKVMKILKRNRFKANSKRKILRMALVVLGVLVLIAISSRCFSLGESFQKGKAQILESMKFPLKKSPSVIQRYGDAPPLVSIAPSGDKLAIIYSRSIPGPEENKKEFRFRILWKNKNEDWDAPFPYAKLVPNIPVRQTHQEIWWPPDGSKLLIRGETWRQGKRSDVLWLIDVLHKSIRTFSDVASDGVLVLYQPWNSKGDKFLWGRREKLSEKLSKLVFFVFDLKNGKSQQIGICEFAPFRLLSSRFFALWDHSSDMIYVWQHEKALWEINPNTGAMRNIANLSSITKDWLASLYLPLTNSFLVDIDLTPIFKVSRHSFIIAWRFGIFDLKTSKYSFTSGKMVTSPETFEKELSEGKCLPSVRSFNVLPFPSDKVLLVIPEIFIAGKPCFLYLFNFQRGVRKTKLELPLPKSEEIADIIWGQDSNTIFVATCDFPSSLQKEEESEEPSHLSIFEAPLNFIKLYKVKLIY